MGTVIKMARVAMVFFLLIGSASVAQAAPEDSVKPDSRCAVCGMFVAKYRNWIAQVRLADQDLKSFDGVKDMMAFYLNPARYGVAGDNAIKEVWVKDYYSMKWLDGRKAFYVVGSDVYGPMGKELIPFGSREAADNFLKDHKGKKVLTFDQITDGLVQSMRSGMKMHHLEMKHGK